MLKKRLKKITPTPSFLAEILFLILINEAKIKPFQKIYLPTKIGKLAFR